MTNAELVVARFREGFSCSQAILATYGESLGVDVATAKRLAAGFSGGMGRLGMTCGAVAGAFMVLGLKFAGPGLDNTQAKEIACQKVRQFAEKFQARHGALACRELLGLDISTPEGFAAAKQQNVFVATCTKLLEDTAAILDEMLGEG